MEGGIDIQVVAVFLNSGVVDADQDVVELEGSIEQSTFQGVEGECDGQLKADLVVFQDIIAGVQATVRAVEGQGAIDLVVVVDASVEVKFKLLKAAGEPCGRELDKFGLEG